jgi:exosortase
LSCISNMSTTLENLAVSPSHRRGIEPYIGATLITAVAILLYWRIAGDLFNDWWTQPNLSQGLLIVPFAAFLAWMRRDETLAHRPVAAPRGLALIAVACFFYVMGTIAAEFFLSRISLVLLLTGCVWTFWGAYRLRTLTFPLILLATAIPLPAIVYNTAAAPLQLFASDVATTIAQSVGVTVYRDGNIINLAHMSLGVEEACSGLNSLSAMMVGGVLVGFLMCKRPLSRWLLVLLSIPLAIAANVVRVGGTAVLADYNEQFAKGFYHMLSGWLVFLVGFAGLVGIAQILRLIERRFGTRASAA